MDILLRSTPAHSNLSSQFRVDRSKSMLHGVNAMSAFVEALGHGVMADLITLQQFAEQGNAKENGIRGRFGHPAASENMTGKQVQVAKNFRVENNHLLHDSILVDFARKSPAFSQDPVEFILAVAEERPTEFAESVVASVDLFWVIDEEGEGIERELTDLEYHDTHYHGGCDVPEDSIYEFPVMRLREGGFRYVDFVNEGALTHNGLFEGNVADIFKGRSSEYGFELFNLVDRWRKQYGIPLEDLELKTTQIVKKYINSRKEAEDMSISDDAITRRNNTRNIGKQALALEAVPDEEETLIEEDSDDEENEEQLSKSEEDSPEPVTDTQELSPSPVEESPVEADPVPAGGTEIAASLNQAQLTLASLAEAEEEQVETNAMQGQINDLSARLDRISQELSTASQLLVSQADWIAKLANNVARIDGEKVVTASVPRHAVNPHDKLEPVITPQGMLNQPNHPQPILNQFSTQGIDGIPRDLQLATDTPQTPAEIAIANQTNRQKAVRLQGSQNMPR